MNLLSEMYLRTGILLATFGIANSFVPKGHNRTKEVVILRYDPGRGNGSLTNETEAVLDPPKNLVEFEGKSSGEPREESEDSSSDPNNPTTQSSKLLFSYVVPANSEKPKMKEKEEKKKEEEVEEEEEEEANEDAKEEGTDDVENEKEEVEEDREDLEDEDNEELAEKMDFEDDSEFFEDDKEDLEEEEEEESSNLEEDDDGPDRSLDKPNEEYEEEEDRHPEPQMERRSFDEDHYENESEEEDDHERVEKEEEEGDEPPRTPAPITSWRQSQPPLLRDGRPHFEYTTLQPFRESRPVSYSSVVYDPDGNSKTELSGSFYQKPLKVTPNSEVFPNGENVSEDSKTVSVTSPPIVSEPSIQAPVNLEEEDEDEEEYLEPEAVTSNINYNVENAGHLGSKQKQNPREAEEDEDDAEDPLIHGDAPPRAVTKREQEEEDEEDDEEGQEEEDQRPKAYNQRTSQQAWAKDRENHGGPVEPKRTKPTLITPEYIFDWTNREQRRKPKVFMASKNIPRAVKKQKPDEKRGKPEEEPEEEEEEEEQEVEEDVKDYEEEEEEKPSALKEYNRKIKQQLQDDANRVRYYESQIAPKRVETKPASPTPRHNFNWEEEEHGTNGRGNDEEEDGPQEATKREPDYDDGNVIPERTIYLDPIPPLARQAFPWLRAPKREEPNDEEQDGNGAAEVESREPETEEPKKFNEKKRQQFHDKSNRENYYEQTINTRFGSKESMEEDVSKEDGDYESEAQDLMRPKGRPDEEWKKESVQKEVEAEKDKEEMTEQTMVKDRPNASAERKDRNQLYEYVVDDTRFGQNVKESQPQVVTKEPKKEAVQTTTEATTAKPKTERTNHDKVHYHKPQPYSFGTITKPGSGRYLTFKNADPDDVIYNQIVSNIQSLFSTTTQRPLAEYEQTFLPTHGNCRSQSHHHDSSNYETFIRPKHSYMHRDEDEEEEEDDEEDEEDENNPMPASKKLPMKTYVVQRRKPLVAGKKDLPLRQRPASAGVKLVVYPGGAKPRPAYREATPTSYGNSVYLAPVTGPNHLVKRVVYYGPNEQPKKVVHFSPTNRVLRIVRPKTQSGMQPSHRMLIIRKIKD